MSLRSKFYLLISFIFLGAGLIIWFGIRPGYEQAVLDERITIITEYQREKVDRTNNQLSSWFASIAEIQRNLSETADISLMQSLFSAYTAILPEMHSIRIVEENTGEYMEIRANPSVSGISMDNLSFQSVTFQNQPFFTAYNQDAQSYYIASNFAILGEPYRLIVLFSTEIFNSFLFSENLGIDEKSVLWITPEKAISNHEIPSFRPDFEPISRVQQKIVDDQKITIISSPIDVINGLFVIYLSEDDINKPVRAIFTQSIWIVGGAYLFLSIIGFVIFGQLTKPLNRFIKDIQPFGSYDFEKQIRTISIPELQVVSETLENIRKKLRYYQRINVEEIISTQQKNQLLMDNATDVIVVFDKNDSFSFVNNRFEQLFQDIGKDAPTNLHDLLNLDFLTIKKERKVNEYTLRHLKVQQYSKEVEFKAENGKSYVFDLHVVEVFKENDERLSGLLLMYDLTQEREADRIRNEMIGIIAHELKNPLSGVMGGVQLLKTNPKAQVVNQIHDIIEDSSSEMLTLINRFLQISKMEASSSNITKELVDTQKVIEQIAHTMSPLFQQKDLEFKLEADASLQPMMLSSDLFSDLVRNLLSNAIKYGPKSRSVDVKLSLKDDNLIFEVTDHGYGIKKEDREQIFKKFYRIKEYQNEQGTGLGLPYVLEIIKKHNGDISVDSNKEIGSRFTVSLPYITQEPSMVDA